MGNYSKLTVTSPAYFQNLRVLDITGRYYARFNNIELIRMEIPSVNLNNIDKVTVGQVIRVSVKKSISSCLSDPAEIAVPISTHDNRGAGIIRSRERRRQPSQGPLDVTG